MTAVEEPPLPTAGPWALTLPPRLGIVGTRGLASRLRRHVDVLAVGPRDDAREVCKKFDALLLELSAFDDATGAWAHALRPAGFDRAQSLARLLRVARLFELPVLGVDDRRPDQRNDPWAQSLTAALDDVAPLGPIVHGGVAWNPGMHWSAEALQVAGPAGEAAAAGSGGTATASVARAAPTGEDWVSTQVAAAACGSVAVDQREPWQAHLATELQLLGVDVELKGGDSAPLDATTPGDALALLCDRLDLDCPPERDVVVITEAPLTDFERGELQAVLGDAWHTVPRDDRAWAAGGRSDDVLATDRVVVTSPDRPVQGRAVAAVLTALDRAPDVAAVAAPQDIAVACRGATLRRLATAAGDLHTVVARTAAPRRVTP